MKNESLVLISIVAIVAVVGMTVMLSTNSFSGTNSAGESYKMISNSNQQKQLTGSRSEPTRHSTSRQCVEMVDEGKTITSLYETAGVSVTFYMAQEGKPTNIRRYADYCTKLTGVDTLVEYSCSKNSSVNKEYIACNCEAGACIDYIPPSNGGNNSNTTNTTIINCTDSDNGLISTIFGVTTGTSFPNGVSDTCSEADENGNPLMLVTSCTASQVAPLNHTCGVIDHACNGTEVLEEFLECDSCSQGICVD